LSLAACGLWLSELGAWGLSLATSGWSRLRLAACRFASRIVFQKFELGWCQVISVMDMPRCLLLYSSIVYSSRTRCPVP
jgi:hypothetical protein